MRGNILRFIRENELIKPGSTLVCAVSGGKDSVCLLHVMLSLQKELSITVKAAHLNHQLRGEESDRDEAFVRSLCESLSVPLTVSHADVLTRCKETGESVEEAARVLRYRFFASLEGVVATAHTQDDNLETVLLNLVRGTALRGLCGIPPKRGQIIRPMLCVSRAEVEQYLLQNDLAHVEDSSNAVLRQEDSYLEKQTSSLLQSCALSSGSWSCSVLRAAPQALQARAMRLLLAQLNIAKPAQAHVDALMHLIASSGGSSSVTLPDGKMLRRSYDILSIAADDLPQTFEPKALLLGGETEIPELSLRISCRFVKKYEKSMQSLCTFAFKYDTIDEIKALCVRPRQAGDEIQLPGGGRSLKKLLIDRKVPRDARSLVPVVADRAGVLLVYPLAVSVSRQAQPGDRAILIHFVHEKEYIQKEDTQ